MNSSTAPLVLYFPIKNGDSIESRWLRWQRDSQPFPVWELQDDVISFLRQSCVDPSEYTVVSSNAERLAEYELRMGGRYVVAPQPNLLNAHDLRLLSYLVFAYLAFGYLKGLWLTVDASFVFFATEVIGFIALPVAACLQIYRSDGLRLRWKNLNADPVWGDSGVLAKSVFAAVLMSVSYWIPYQVSRSLLPNALSTDSLHYASMLPDVGPSRIVAILYLLLSAAIVEEFIFRGCLRILFTQWFDRNIDQKFILFSSLIFGFVHWNHGLPVVVGAISAGAIAAWLVCFQIDIRPVVSQRFQRRTP